MPTPVSRADFSRRAGVSDAAISKWAKGPGAAALVGSRIDVDHPAARAYLASKGAAPTPRAKAVRKTPAKPTGVRRAPPLPGESPERAPREKAPPVETLPSDFEKLDDFADLTLRDFCERYGSAQGAKDWLDARKKIADIREKDLKNSETDGRLIERDLVKVHVFGAIESANRQLLGDSPKTMARRLYALAKSGAPIEEAERVIRDLIGSQLKPVKATASRVLRNA